MSKIPGLSNVPLLGALFKSRQEQKSSTELVVMVTPEITTPLNRADVKALPPMPKFFLPPALLAGTDKGAPPAAPPKPAVKRK
jgi:Flp pilus assembly secretin CpaC